MDHLNLLNDTGDYVKWIKAEFAPITLITPDSTISQCVNNAVRYFNTHSAYRYAAMANITDTVRIELPAQFKNVYQVVPNNTDLALFGGLSSMWALTGVAILDNVTTDLIYLTEALKNYQTYLGLGFQWMFEPNMADPEGKGTLLLQNIPGGVTKVFIIGTRRIISSDKIEDQFINDWLLRYTKALVKQVEGSSLRKSNIIIPGLDGQEMVSEGTEEMKTLQDELRVNARWVSFAKRT